MHDELKMNSQQAVGGAPDLPKTERRDWWRWTVQTFLGVRCEPDQKPIYGRTRDLSNKGMGAVIPASLEPGDEVTLEFALNPDEPAMTVTAVVRHRRCFHYGFEFIGLKAGESEAIERACREESPTPSIRILEPKFAMR
jgi:c-di-GMP-binding flagellar brake protein YcgR